LKGEGIRKRKQGRRSRAKSRNVFREGGEGSGMGLDVVKKLVESRGGTIQVISAVNVGATFRFTWPISIVSEADTG